MVGIRVNRGAQTPSEDWPRPDAQGIQAPAAPLIRDGATYRDVHQGQLPTCSALASFAALASLDGGYIARFVKIDPVGGFIVHFYGAAKSIRVPLESTGKGALLVGEDGKPERWTRVLESAYITLRGGTAEEWEAADVLADLTGNRFTTAPTSDREQTWRCLVAQAAATPRAEGITKMRAPVVAHVPSDGFFRAVLRILCFGQLDTIRQWLGQRPLLAGNHDYAVVGLGEERNLGRVVHLYDPHGRAFALSFEDFCATFDAFALVDEAQ